MKVYLVGGAVRDELLGRPVHDRDYVVVGARSQDMLELGFLPVGKDFPVFLHPQTREEWALARTERKTAPGYAGFSFHASPEVTLEQDLARRDITINAMAREVENTTGANQGDKHHHDRSAAQNAPTYIDPFGGRADLERRVLRHVTEAFREDPVRILRVARFAARFADFAVAPETTALMRTMVANGEVDALVAERVWQELARGLIEAQPGRMFEVLQTCGALTRLVPSWNHSAAQPVLARMASSAAPLAVRFAALAPAGGASWLALKAPHEALDLGRGVLAHAEAFTNAPDDLAEAVSVLERADAFRRADRFELLQQALQLCASVNPQWAKLWRAAASVDVASVAQSAMAAGAQGAAIGAAVSRARVAALQALDSKP